MCKSIKYYKNIYETYDTYKKIKIIMKKLLT